MPKPQAISAVNAHEYTIVKTDDGKRLGSYRVLPVNKNFATPTVITYKEYPHHDLVVKTVEKPNGIAVESYYVKGQVDEVCFKNKGVCVDRFKRAPQESIKAVKKALKALKTSGHKAVVESIVDSSNIKNSFIRVV